MTLITSTGNARVKAIRALRRRKVRDESGLFWIEGIRPVAEAVDARAPVVTLVVSPEQLTSNYARDIVRNVRQGAVEVVEVSRAVFESLADRENPQGIGAVVHQVWTPLHDANPEAGLCWVALDSVADPGNLGAIVRTSDAVGAAGVILLGESTDPHDPSATRGAMGALFDVRLVRSSVPSFLDWCREHGVYLVGSSDRGAVHYRQAAYRRPAALLMGSERQGLSQPLLDACDQVVRLPMHGRSDSLNLAVATGILLYDLLAHPESLGATH